VDKKITAGLPIEELTDLRDAFRQLRLKDRQLLWLAYVEGQKSAQIAVSLGVTPEAARKRLERAAGRLRDALGPSYPDSKENR
jgi:RNA polymerase sigma factor (sigma-70 family)